MERRPVIPVSEGTVAGSFHFIRVAPKRDIPGVNKGIRVIEQSAAGHTDALTIFIMFEVET